MKSIYEVWHPELRYWYKVDNKKSYKVFKALGYKGRINRPKSTNSDPVYDEVKHRVLSLA